MPGTDSPIPDPKPRAAEAPTADTALNRGPESTDGHHGGSTSLAFLSPPVAPDELGRLEGYRVLKILGEGGMGIVFLAEEIALRRPVALKVMKPEAAAKPLARERFLREGRAAAALRCDHIITIYHVGEANGVPYLAMEYLEGCTLEDWLTKKPDHVTLIPVLRIAIHVFRGLQAAHEKGLIHRDIKPTNLWLEKRGRVKILDFGLIRAENDDERLTRQGGGIIGTPAYMAPEQATGNEVDSRADLFSVGVLIYRMLSRRSPFHRDTMMATLFAVATENPPPLSEIVPNLPPALAQLVRKLMAKDPAKRPPTAAVAHAKLVEIHHELINAPASPTPPREPPPPRRERARDYDEDDYEDDEDDHRRPRRDRREPLPPQPRSPFWAVVVASSCIVAVLLLVGYMLYSWAYNSPENSLDGIKAATVYLRTNPEGFPTIGAGFFGVPGSDHLILTNNQVVDMTSWDAKRPSSIDVILYKGTADEATLKANLSYSDLDSGLAAVVLVNPPQGVRLPRPVKIHETQPSGKDRVRFLGFSGQMSGSKIIELPATVGVLEINPSRLTVDVKPDAGFSGGPVVDTRGQVVGIALGGKLGKLNDSFVPGDQVRKFLTENKHKLVGAR